MENHTFTGLALPAIMGVIPIQRSICCDLLSWKDRRHQARIWLYPRIVRYVKNN
ncbi:hypothetical protein B0570_004487 [Salmonella enterica subsp. enterica serovar Benue]|nr:hypothetical protein [Salmonella enterica subsp. enterica serovar Hillingdon]EDR3562129.1 hypothetical protein [Salmonella enterica subsp. enterica serovar Benue]EDR6326952.1 hypothetical protein [Salmonella enterica subsp. enterica serovar Hillingdon]